MKVNICGLTYIVDEKEDVFNSDATHFGQITYTESKILINKDITEDKKKETLCHEILHGILHHLGEFELNDNESFVSRLANGIAQSFDIKYIEE